MKCLKHISIDLCNCNLSPCKTLKFSFIQENDNPEKLRHPEGEGRGERGHRWGREPRSQEEVRTRQPRRGPQQRRQLQIFKPSYWCNYCSLVVQTLSNFFILERDKTFGYFFRPFPSWQFLALNKSSYINLDPFSKGRDVIYYSKILFPCIFSKFLNQKYNHKID